MSAIRRLGGVFVLGLLVWTGTSAQEAVRETAEVYQGEAAEQFLTKARIVRMQAVPTGVTAPRRATLELDGVTRSAAFKTVHEERPGLTQLNTGQVEVNFVDTWRTEIAAYVVDRIIGLGLVPATVERSYQRTSGSLQWWVESEMSEAQRIRDKINPPDTEAWNRQQFKMQLFDNLIYNTDRHLNNLLVTKDFEIRLIDHSRSFRGFNVLKPDHTLTRFSRSLLAGLEKLEADDLNKRLRRYLSPSQITSMLRRRDAILELAKRLVEERGEAAVLYP
jgi:hypothetical protein